MRERGEMWIYLNTQRTTSTNKENEGERERDATGVCSVSDINKVSVDFDQSYKLFPCVTTKGRSAMSTYQRKEQAAYSSSLYLCRTYENCLLQSHEYVRLYKYIATCFSLSKNFQNKSHILESMYLVWE